VVATYREFLIDLYREHLEEASFLVEQRRHLLTDDELPWVQLAEFEDRLEAHLDALVVGGELALEACRAAAADGDPGQLFAAVTVFCRLERAPLLAHVLKVVDLTDADRTAALSEALRYELPVAWRDHCSRAIEQGDDRLVPILAEAMAYRRLRIETSLLPRLSTAPRTALPSLLWCLGRTPAAASVSAVRELIQSDDPATAEAAVRAGLRLRDQPTFHTLTAARGDHHDPIALGLAGGPQMVRALLEALNSSEPTPDVLTGLALLGDLSAVRPLADCLSIEALAGSAAEALRVITGAPLVEDAIILDEISEEEMLPHELAVYRETGERPRRADGQAFGTNVGRVSRDPAVWQDWLNKNASRFIRGRRYRFGECCSPRVLLDCLQSEVFPKSYRPWVAEELLIRYDIDLSFEADMFVIEQRRVLDAARARIEATSGAFESGQWYFGGHLIS